MAIPKAESLQWSPEWWSMVLREAPHFSHAVVLARKKLAQEITDYIEQYSISIPDFSKVTTAEQLFETGWRFHKTHWGMLVPPYCPIEQQTVAIYCQLSGIPFDWKNPSKQVVNPHPYQDVLTGKSTHEHLFVTAHYQQWLMNTWNSTSTADSPRTQPVPWVYPEPVFDSKKFWELYLLQQPAFVIGATAFRLPPAPPQKHSLAPSPVS